MAEGRSRAEWGRLSHLLALTANCHRDPKKRPVRPAEFNPHAPGPAAGGPAPPVSVEQLTREVLAVSRSRVRRGRFTPERPKRPPGGD